eukprot:maker-scaffold_74-snap-gene-0.21-mRNA-1 protein AED:0.29 eAED:0.30 QI:0/0/0/1/1/1/2/0/505
MIKLPSNYSSFTHQEKESWKKENILNRFRMVSNMIRLNNITVPTSLNLANLERQLLSIKNPSFYATLDVLSGFDFLPTNPDHRDIFTLVTRRSAYIMLGAPMGWKNTPALFFDRVVNEIIDWGEPKYFTAENNGVIAWLDDLLVYATTFSDLCRIIKDLMDRAAKRRVRFNLRKCEFGPERTIWCGREIKQGLWNFSPTFFENILSMPKPVYRFEAAQLLSPNIPQLASLRQPFADFANLKGKKLIQVQQEKEEIKWTKELDDAYIRLKEAIVSASKRFLSTYDESKPILLFTDSSNSVWSLAVFQNDEQTITNDVRTLQPKPMMFLSGSFSVSETRWHIASKELYPIVYAFERIGFLLRTHSGGIYVYTDHRSLLSVIKTKENEKRIYWDRLYRWAIRLQSVDMTVFHISSRDNFVSDLLTRWGNRQSLKTARCFFTLDLSCCNQDESDIDYFSGDSEDEINHEEESTPFNMTNDADVCISSGEDWQTVLEDESRHVEDIFMGK